MSDGWVSVHRQISDHWIWQRKPFSEGQAWVDLVMLANHKDKKMIFQGAVVLVARGSTITSILKLSQRWGWTRKKTTTFLSLLEADKMLTRDSTPQGTTITLQNYDLYQITEQQSFLTLPEVDHNSSENGTPEGTTEKLEHEGLYDNRGQQKVQQRDNEGTTKGQRRYINNNDNNDNNLKDKKDIVEYLNEKAGKNFKASTKKTNSCIQARLNDGFSVEDFKRVIDTKVAEWGNDSYWNKFLRPETLFGDKFEGYLNQTTTGSRPLQNQPKQLENFKQRDYDNLDNSIYANFKK